MSYGKEKLAAFRKFISGTSMTVGEAWPLFYEAHPKYASSASGRAKKSPKRSPKKSPKRSPKKSKGKRVCSPKKRRSCTRNGRLCNPLSGKCILPSTVGSLRLKLSPKRSPKRR